MTIGQGIGLLLIAIVFGLLLYRKIPKRHNDPDPGARDGGSLLAGRRRQDEEGSGGGGGEGGGGVD